MSGGMTGGCIVPHPPLLIPDIGGRDREAVRSTHTAMEELSRRIAALRPETLVMISPHTPPYRDSFTIKAPPSLGGSFASFGHPQVRITKRNDLDLAAAVMHRAESEGLPLLSLQEGSSRWSDTSEELDHGLLVPLYFLDQEFDTPIICLSISGLSYQSHFHLGRIVAEACVEADRRAFFVASGDLSHRLIKGAPAGYSARAQEFDRRIVAIAASGDFDALYDIEEELVDAAGECGFRSIHTLWGALKDGPFTSEVLSYEGPFGVGYMVSLHLKS